MENKEKEIDLEGKIEIISDIISEEKKMIEKYNEAIKNLTGKINIDMIDCLACTYKNKVSSVTALEAMKARLENRTLGDPVADRIFSVCDYY